MSDIPLPPPARYLGRRVTATWHGGSTATGVLTDVRETGITIRRGRSTLPIPLDAVASLREADGDPVSDQTTDRAVERLNEIRDQLMTAAAQMDGVTDVYALDAAPGVFRIARGDGSSVTVDLWHDGTPTRRT